MRTTLILAAALGIGLAAPAMAQGNYPNKPIRMLTSFAPGGTTDILARLIGPKLSEKLGQPVVVENRPGAGGNTGTDYVAKSAPDGYTLLMASSGPLAINPTLFKSMPFDPMKDLAPVSLVASVPLVVVVPAASGIKTIQDLIRTAKAQPGKLNSASAGNGTPQHLSLEYFKTLTGTDIVHVPYRGTGPAINDVVAGQIQMTFESLIAVLSHIQGGTLSGLAITSRTRSPLLPDLPTVIESGVPNYETIAWYPVVAPAGTPEPILDRLSTAIAEILKEPEMKKRLVDLGSVEVDASRSFLAGYMRSEFDKWSAIVKQSGATVD